MKLLNQGKTSQCFLYSYAMLVGRDPDELQYSMGVTGKEVVFPDLPEPYCFRSFHPNDFICYTAVKGGSLITYEVNPLIQGHPTHEPKLLWEDKECAQRFGFMIGFYSGIFLSLKGRHAAAWNSEEGRVYDPAKGVVSLAWWLEKHGVDFAYLLSSPLTRD